LHLAHRAQAAESLRVVADRLRFAINLELLTPTQLRELEAQCGRVWEQREPMLNTEPGEFSTEFEDRLRADLLDVVIIWTEVRIRLATADMPPRIDVFPAQATNAAGHEVTSLRDSVLASAREDALRILREARATLGDSIVLARIMHSYTSANGSTDAAP